jgi:predicted Zn-dependent peptidase
MKETQLIQLPNGLRVVIQHQSSPISHACLLIHTGSRDEPLGQYGLAHFIEHLLFKQTERRNTHQILNRLESVGADLNAYTTKEYTCIHASFLTPYLERALDLFEDLCFHSLFPAAELVKEKGVILDEMASYLDSPEDAVLDDFEDLVFGGHALGHNILGVETDLASMERSHITQFIQKHYVPSQIVIGISGQYTLAKVTKLIEKLFGSLEAKELVVERTPPSSITVSEIELTKPINQVHQVLGSRAPSLHESDKTATMLLSNYLGGMGMSSRLNLLVREKHGIAYTIESSYIPFTDTGLFYIYFGTDTEKAEKAMKLVERELKRLKEQPLSPVQLAQAQRKFKGQIALGEENRMGLLIALCKNVQDYGRILALDEVFQEIDRVSAGQIMDLANRLFDRSNRFGLTFLPDPHSQEFEA